MPAPSGRVEGPSGRAGGPVRSAAVAGSFYPDDPDMLRTLVGELLHEAARTPEAIAGRALGAGPIGLLVPHAGLAYSGIVAAAGWRTLRDRGTRVVLLGTNHGAGWLHGIGAWDAGSWEIPTGRTPVDEELAATIVGLGPPFVVDRAAHRAEHSIEVQLPILSTVDPAARIVPLAVSAGTGDAAIEAGTRLGTLLASWPGPGRVLLAISSDMAHYPAREVCAMVTAHLLDAILAADPVELAAREASLCARGLPGLSCGMCGIMPAVVGLAAVRAMGVRRGVLLGAATSADAGGPPDRTVGYLSVGWTRPGPC